MHHKKQFLPGLAVLLAVAAIWHLSGCTSMRMLMLSKQEKIMFESFRKQVRETVDDPERAEQLIEIGEDLSFQLHDYTNKLSKMATHCKDTNADYDATPEQLESCYRTLDDHRRSLRKIILQSRSQAVALTTAAEWEALSSRKNSMQDLMEQAPGLF